MSNKTVFLLAFLSFMVFCLHADEGVPTAVSPGTSQGVALVESCCPAFSWSGVAWALKYRVVVFAVTDPGARIDDESRQAIGNDLRAMPDAGPEAHHKPVLSVEIAAGALSWTPDISQGLHEGVMYAWCVGALDAGGAWAWSELKRFRVVRDTDLAKEKKESAANRERNDAAQEDGLPKAGAGQSASASAADSHQGQEEPLVKATEGTYSTFFGTGAGANNSQDDNANSFFGSNAGFTTSSGSQNTFMGGSAGYANTTGYSNTFLGFEAGKSNSIGNANAFVGERAGFLNSSGNGNVFMGYWAGTANTTGEDNVFIGRTAGLANETGAANIFIGSDAGHLNSTGSDNTFIGYNSGYSNSTGISNTFIGYLAGNSNLTASANTFVGSEAGRGNATGFQNTLIGYNAGYSSGSGSNNVFLGDQCGFNNNSGSYNTFIGRAAGYANYTGSGNVFIGFNAGHDEAGSDKLYIDNSATATPLIQGDFAADSLQVNGTFQVTGATVLDAGASVQGDLDVSGLIHAASLSLDSGATTITSQELNLLDGKTLATGTADNNMLVTKGYVDESDDIGGGLTGNDMSEGYLCKWDDVNSRLVNSLLSETTGAVGINGKLGIGTTAPACSLDLRSTGTNNILSISRSDGATFKLSAMGSSGQLGTVSAHPVNFMTNNVKRLTLAVSGNVGIGVTQPAHPLHMASGAYCSAGGTWTNASSLALKENISALNADEASAALRSLNPVKFNYKADASEICVGFIAEEVPELVATNDRKSLSPMDIVAVLAKVLQQQQAKIAELENEVKKLKERQPREN